MGREGTILQDQTESIRNCFNFVFDDQPRSLANKRCDTTSIGDDDGRTTRNRFGSGISKILVQRREDEDIGIAIGSPFCFFVERSGEKNVCGNSRCSRQRFKVYAVSVSFFRTSQNENRRNSTW